MVNLSLLAAVFGIIFVAELPDKTALASLVLGTRYRPGFVFFGMAAAFALHVIIAVAAGSALSLAPQRIVEAIVAVLFLAGAVLLLCREEDGPDDRHASSRPSRRRERAPGGVSAGGVSAGGVSAGGVSAGKVSAGTVSAGTVSAGTVSAGTVSAGGERGPHDETAVLTRAPNQRAVRLAGFWKAAATSFGVLFVAEFGDLTQIATANLAARYHDPLTVGIGAVLGLWAVGGLAILGGRQLLRWIPLRWIARAAALVMTLLGVISAVQVITG